MPPFLSASSTDAMSFFELIVESDRYRIRSMATARPITRQRSTGSIHSQPPSRNFCIITWCMLSPAIWVSATTVSVAAAASCANALTVPNTDRAADGIKKSFFIVVLDKLNFD